ncbi:unnamed protein product [Lathyrus sativus]|nr:unnamed protein product [Lathyrus sativus]
MKVELEVYVNDVLYMSKVIDESWKRFMSLIFVGKSALRSRIGELPYPITTSMCPPHVKLKTKGEVKKKGKKPVGYDVYRDPSYHEYVDQTSQSSKRQYQLIHHHDSLLKRPSHSSRKSTIISFQFSHLFTIVGRYS